VIAVKDVRREGGEVELVAVRDPHGRLRDVHRLNDGWKFTGLRARARRGLPAWICPFEE
jgi:hypothetical protein